jgi:hypothetical protein
MTTPPISGSTPAPVRTATAASATKAAKATAVAGGAAATTATSAAAATPAAAPAKFSTVLGAKVKEHAAQIASQTPHVVAAKKVSKAVASARPTTPAAVAKTEET